MATYEPSTSNRRPLPRSGRKRPAFGRSPSSDMRENSCSRSARARSAPLRSATYHQIASRSRLAAAESRGLCRIFGKLALGPQPFPAAPADVLHQLIRKLDHTPGRDVRLPLRDRRPHPVVLLLPDLEHALAREHEANRLAVLHDDEGAVVLLVERSAELDLVDQVAKACPRLLDRELAHGIAPTPLALTLAAPTRAVTLKAQSGSRQAFVTSR